MALEKYKLIEYEKSFIHHMMSKYDLDSVNLSIYKDFEDILMMYKRYMVSKITERNMNEPDIYPIHGLKISQGFNLIYGQPDSLKTTTLVNIANYFSNTLGMQTLYVDAENKLPKELLSPDIYLVPGKTNTHNILRSATIMNTYKVMIIDTIVAMSRYNEFLKTMYKHIEQQGLYIIYANQTRAFRFGAYSAGTDIINSSAKNSYRIVSTKHVADTYYVRFDNKSEAVFSNYIYNPVYSAVRIGMNTGYITKIGNNYKIGNETIDKKTTYEIIPEYYSSIPTWLGNTKEK